MGRFWTQVERKETDTPAPICPEFSWAPWMREHAATAVSYLEMASVHFHYVKARSCRALELIARSFYIRVCLCMTENTPFFPITALLRL